MKTALPLLRRCLVRALCALLAGGASATEHGGDSIVWAVVDWAPYMILPEGSAPATPQELGAGSVDRVLAEVIAQLPQYRHSFQLTNPQRLWPALQRGQNLCYPVAVKTPERLAYALFTPLVLVPPIAVVVHEAKRRSLVGTGDSVSLKRLMQRHPEAGRLLDVRSYGPQLDALIASHGQAVRRERMPALNALLRPLSAGLFGYTLEYPSVVEYARRQGELVGPLKVLNITEAQDWVVGHVACTRNDWGRQVTADIDAAIRKTAQLPAVRSASASWLPPEYVQRHAERLRAFHDDRARSGAQID